MNNIDIDVDPIRKFASRIKNGGRMGAKDIVIPMSEAIELSSCLNELQRYHVTLLEEINRLMKKRSEEVIKVQIGGDQNKNW